MKQLTAISFFLVALVCLANSALAVSCYRLRPQTPGWKAVEVPKGFTASSGVEQFRLGNKVTLWRVVSLSDSVVFEKQRLGWRHRLTVRLGGDLHSALRIKMSPAIDNLRVSASLQTLSYRELFNRVRYSGDHLVVRWKSGLVNKVHVTFHTHFKKPPEIEQVWAGRQVDLKPRALAKSFRKPKYLFFRSPDGKPLDVCNGQRGPYQVFEVPRDIIPARITLPAPHEKRRSRNRFIGLLVIVSLSGLILVGVFLAR